MMVSGAPSAIIVFAGPLDPSARCAEWPVAAGANELDQGHDRRHVVEIGRNPREPLGTGAVAVEYCLIGGAERMNGLPVETAALEPDNVEAAKPRSLADRRGK